MNKLVAAFDPFFNMYFAMPKRKDYGMMKTDIIENEDSYDISVVVPGIKKEDIKISLEDNVLTVKAEYKTESEEKDKYLCKERQYGEFSRSYSLDEGTTKKDISASLENGILTLHIKKPVKVEEKSDYIEIN